MLRPERHPLVTIALLAAYLAAGTASSLLHDHGHDPACQHDAACHATGHSAADHDDHEHGDATGALGLSAAPAAHDDDCVVCQFLGQRVIQAQIAPLPAGHAPSFDVALVHTSQPVSASPRTTHSRAPPLVG
jgi:hypothetical protein